MSSWRGTGVEYDEYSSRMIARWEMKRIGDMRAWNYRCARIKYSSSQRCIYTMWTRAIEYEQTNAVVVMGTVIKSERTRPFIPETGILKLCIRERMNLSEHKSTHWISMRIEWGFQLAFNAYILNYNYCNYFYYCIKHYYCFYYNCLLSIASVNFCIFYTNNEILQNIFTLWDV